MEEKIITVNVRKKLLKMPKWRRATHAVRLIRQDLEKRLKTNVKIGRGVNEKIWARGMETPASKIRLRIEKIDEKTSRVELA